MFEAGRDKCKAAGLSMVRLFMDSTNQTCSSNLSSAPFSGQPSWVHKLLSSIEIPWYFHFELLVGFWSQPLMEESLIGPWRKGWFP